MESSVQTPARDPDREILDKLKDPLFLSLDRASYPLEMFDRTIEETDMSELPLGTKARTRRYVSNGTYEWTPCEVLSYDDPTFTIRLGGEDNNKIKKGVRRLNLAFDSESFQEFQARCERAHELRRKVMSDLRFEHYLKMQRNDMVAPIQQRWVENILFKAGASKASVSKLRNLTSEIFKEYTSNSIRQVTISSVKNSEPFRRKLENLRIDRLEIPEEIPIPRFGNVRPEKPPRFNRDKCFERINRNAAIAQDVVVDLVTWMRRTWRESFGGDGSRISVFDMARADSDESRVAIDLDTFLKDCKSHSTELRNKLERAWYRGVVARSIDHLQSAYSIFETRRDAYERSKLYVFDVGLSLSLSLSFYIYSLHQTHTHTNTNKTQIPSTTLRSVSDDRSTSRNDQRKYLRSCILRKILRNIFQSQVKITSSFAQN